jgi:hypothetical protein
MSFFEKQPGVSNSYSVNFKDILKQLKEITYNRLHLYYIH